MARTPEEPIRLPDLNDRSGRRGVAGYRGNVVTYDRRQERDRARAIAAGSVIATVADEAPAATTAVITEAPAEPTILAAPTAKPARKPRAPKAPRG